MIRKYPGTVVDSTKKELTREEFAVLEWLYEHRGFSFKAWEIASHFKHNIRKIVSALSSLNGMDLVISTKFPYTLTQTELEFFSEGDYAEEPHYFIRKDDSDIITRRAFNVVNCKGSLHNLEYIQPPTSDMFPLRPKIKWTFYGDLNFDTNTHTILIPVDSKMFDELHKAVNGTGKSTFLVKLEYT